MSDYQAESDLLQATLADMDETIAHLDATETELRGMLAQEQRRKQPDLAFIEAGKLMLQTYVESREAIQKMRAETLLIVRERPASDELQ